MTDHLGTLTMVDHVGAALALVPPAVRASAPARSAVMYAESIDDDDEGDGFFRFGSRLLTALEALGLASTARALLLPRPMIGRLQPIDQPHHLVPVRSHRVALAA
jgi:hypothetical protein